MAKDIIPPYNRAYLIQVINGTEQPPIEITDDVMNWFDADVKQSRDGFSGVFVEIAQELQVCNSRPNGTRTMGNGKQILHDIFMTYGLGAQVYLEIHRRHNFILTQYTVVYRGMLNFGTYTEDRDKVTIGSESRDFNSLISSLGKTKYDIPITTPKDDKPVIPTVEWKYQHNQVIAGGYYTIAEAEQSMLTVGVTGPTIQSLSINLDDRDIPFGGVENDFKSQALVWKDSSGQLTEAPDDYFFMVDPNHNGNFQFYFGAKFRLSWDPSQLPATGIAVYFVFGYTTLDGVFHLGQNVSIDNTRSYYDANWPESWYSLPPGAKLQLFMFFDGLSNAENRYFTFKIENFEFFNIRYIDKSKHTDTIPAVTPIDLSNRLLSEMAASLGETPYTTQIDADDLAAGYEHFLVAGESIRGWENDTFHASYNDFLEYMQFLGYEWEVNETTRRIIFHKRSYFFTPGITALNLAKEEVAGLVIKADPEYAYSTVKIGYEKPDIENTNGKFAICGTNDYTTDYKGTPTDENVLEIQCPYKADPVEIEVLSWSRGEKTKDTKSDNNIFMLAAMRNADGTITEYRDLQYQATVDQFTVQFYNAPYIPYFIALRNVDKVGIVANELKFAGTDAFREATLSGPDPNASVDIYGGITVTNKLFLPIIYEFEAGTHRDLPDLNARRGLIRFMWDGEQRQGYIQEIVKNCTQDRGATWTLLAK